MILCIPLHSLPQSGESPLYVAAHNNHQQVVQLLLDNGADINLQREVIKQSVCHAGYMPHLQEYKCRST